MSTTDIKERAHELIDRLAPNQVSAVVGVIEALLDPVTTAIAAAPLDDEPLSPEDSQALERSEAWFEGRGGNGIPMEEVLADFGLTMEDLAENDVPQH
jgi:hypothetical protein